MEQREREYWVEGLLLSACDYGEGNRIFEVYTKERGRISVTARGIKKSKSKLKGHLQIGNRVLLTVTTGKGYGIITDAKTVDAFESIRENSLLYFYSAYYSELLRNITPQEVADEELFYMACSCMKLLPLVEPKLLTRFYEVQLLKAFGVLPDFGVCNNCGAPLKEGVYHSGRRVLLCHSCGKGTEVTPKALFAFRYLVDADLRTMTRLKMDDETLRRMGKLTGRMIENSIERKIKSAAFIE